MKILSVVGARPNFMKIAPIIEEMRRHRQITNYLVHTGQHYNKELSDFFFRDLNMPKPQVHLGVGSGSHAEQTAKILTGVEKILISKKPDLVIVVGDCNSTIGGALAAAKLNIPVAHVEAGLRSFNMKMPEEKNRILTDHIADLLFTTEESANKNLAREGIPMEKIKFVGNVMIDSLKKHKKHAMKSKILEKIGVRKGKYVVLTMHRPENTDHKDILKGIIDALDEIQEKIDLVWPLHPRAKKQLIKFGLFNRIKKMKNLHLIDSQGYFDFMKLMIGAKFVITDSGGVQEETTMLGVGCITIRNETERPITVKQGTNIIAGNGKKGILRKVNAALKKKRWKVRVPKYWDGRASKRIIAEILKPKKSQKC